MSESQSHRILARLNVGFRTDSTRLNALEQHLDLTLRTARTLGSQPGLTPEWNADWNQHWDQIETALGHLRVQLGEMAGFVGAAGTGTLDSALTAWNSLQAAETTLLAALESIRTSARELKEPFQTEWQELSTTLETHLATLNALSETMRIRLELLTDHPRSAVDQLVNAVVATLPSLPDSTAGDAAEEARGYRKAVLELEREQHRFLEFFDALKALSMWVETPEERVAKRRLSRPANTPV